MSRERMLSDVTVEERRISLAGSETAVLEAGAGPPLVLLHGGIECGAAYWAPVVDRLASERRLVMPDVPGLGESAPVKKLDPPAFGAWLEALVGQTCAEPPELIAHSLIGTAAARAATERPRLLRRLTIYASPGIGPYRMPLGLRIVAIRFGLRPTARNMERFDRWAFFDFDRARERDAEWIEAWNSYTMGRASVGHVKRTMRTLVPDGTRRVPDADLQRIDAPVDLVWGRHDRFVPLAVAEEASARLDWPLTVIDETGHVPHIERPDAFAAALDGREG